MIEHSVSISTLQRIYILNKFLLNNPDVMKRFENFKIKTYKDMDCSDFPFHRY